MDEVPQPQEITVSKPADASPDGAESISAGKGVKETVESILIAFILAFVFRAFVVEAFVIPTGSMATTLMGAHMRFTCSECGTEYQVGWDSRSSSDDIEIPPLYQGKLNHECPNCHFVEQHENPPIHYGDRILVLKYLYIPWLSQPQRWDVVVFKNPQDSDGKPPYSQNYIKRLVGLPGESLLILDGDLYVRRDKDGVEHWEIQDKPRHAQDALWRVVYDHDHRPLLAAPGRQWSLPWTQTRGTGWVVGLESAAQPVSRTFEFNNPTGEGVLAFDGRSDSRYFTDWLAYDGSNYQTYTCSDIKLSFFYERHSGDGPLRARLTKHGHEFELEISPQSARLSHRLPQSQEVREIPLRQPVTRAQLSQPMRVDFESVDYRVRVRFNDQVVFETSRSEFSPDWKTLRQYQLIGKALPAPSVSLTGVRQTATLSHISLWRDVYYTPAPSYGQPHADRPIVLGAEAGKEEYFVLGDNSAKSLDARAWTKSVHLEYEDLEVEGGRVPGRFMLGRAFFVYWPAGFKPLRSSPASLVPNFGEMRLIR